MQSYGFIMMVYLLTISYSVYVCHWYPLLVFFLCFWFFNKMLSAVNLIKWTKMRIMVYLSISIYWNLSYWDTFSLAFYLLILTAHSQNGKMAVIPLAKHSLSSFMVENGFNQRFLIMMKKSNLDLSAALSSSCSFLSFIKT